MGRFSAEIDDESDDEGVILQESSLIRRRGRPQEPFSSSYANYSRQPTAEHTTGASFHRQQNDPRFYNDLIYRNEDPMQFDPTMIESEPPRRSFLWNFCLVVFLIIMQHYLPPPPPPNNTWHEYVSSSTEGIKSTIQNLTALLFYITSGTLGNVYADGAFWINLVISGGNKIGHDKDHLCRLMVPDLSSSDEISHSAMNSSSVIMNFLQNKITGQKFALETISETLTSWDPFSSSSKGHDGHVNESVKNLKRPLTILFTGSDGVGKYETAKQVGHALLNGCQISLLKEHLNECDDRPSCLHDNGNGILEIRGVDYALENDVTIDGFTDGSSSGSSKEMIRVILNHIHGRGNAGAVVILKHVEDLSRGAKMALVRLLGKSSVSFTKPKRNVMIASLFAGVQQDEVIDLQLGNSLFIITTDLGANRIFEGLRSAMSTSSKLLHDGIKNDIVKDVESHFGQNDIFDAIVPFWPLQYADMEQIMQRKMSNENVDDSMDTQELATIHRIRVQESLIKFLVSPSIIEYIEMRTTSARSVSNDETFIFAKNGGHDIPSGSLLREAVNEVLEQDSFHSQDEVIVLDYSGRGDEMILKICSVDDDRCIERSTLNLFQIFNL